MSMFAPDQGGAGVPPELAAMMGGGGGAPQNTPPELSPVDHLRQAIEHAQMALSGEPDDQLSNQLAGAVKTLYGIFAALQKQEEAAMGSSPQTKFMARKQAGY